MNAITPFVFEDKLVRTVQFKGEIWFVGRDICDVLGLANAARSIDRLDKDEKGVHSVNTPGGVQEMIIISEAGTFRLIFTSRKPEAERMMRWLAHEVLPQLRRTGRYAITPSRAAFPELLDEAPLAAIAAKLSLVRETRLIYGTRRAQALWEILGLPMPPDAVADAADEARDCLRALLMAETGEGRCLLERIAAALDGDTEQDIRLYQWGIKLRGNGFIVANRHAWLTETFKGTAGDYNRWPYVLRRLPGIAAADKESFAGHVSRTTFVPGKYLDLGALPLSGKG